MHANLILRLSKPQDISQIMQLIKYAQKFFYDSNINQWQNNYPNENIIQNDIDNKESYVVCDGLGKIVATAMISFAAEPTYKVIKGKWISNDYDKYAVVHRIAVDPTHKGKRISGFILQKVMEMLPKENAVSIRIDTHRENTSMQKVIERMNFKYCGIIYVDDEQERLAYEKTYL